MATECATLYPHFMARDVRTATTTNVETVQQEGSFCFENDRLVELYNNRPDVRSGQRHAIPGNRLIPLSRPAYTDSQYAGLTQLYLRAALEARVLPTITTHLVIDRGISDHCDPRCFDLGRLYRV
jgi:hypothetical protein